MFASPDFWVLISFLLFIGLLLYLKVPARVAEALDARAKTIAKELEEARKLREEAQQLLASYERKQREAEEEAKSIVEQAREEAERLAEETRKQLGEQIERRKQLAEDKIAQAEAQAVLEVRGTAAEVAAAAAARLIEEKVEGEKADRIIENSISEVRSKLH